MYRPTPRPRITDFKQISELVSHFRQQGVLDKQMARRINEIGAIDLDMLAMVLRGPGGQTKFPRRWERTLSIVQKAAGYLYEEDDYQFPVHRPSRIEYGRIPL